MTIEKAHEILSNGLVNAPSEHEWCVAFKTALDIMRNYQKLQRVNDKIRADIQENINYNKKMNYQGIVAGLLLSLNIIDKYKAESEVEVQ